MTDRSYLSIGEVLSLLTAEFPDVTISKIRFLESQGLIDPERTPSGYRKFYETDVDRLKWILRQQRENFLPLKVIRGRLGDETDEAPEPEPVEAPRPTPDPGAVSSPPPVPSPVHPTAAPASSRAPLHSVDEGPTPITKVRRSPVSASPAADASRPAARDANAGRRRIEPEPADEVDPNDVALTVEELVAATGLTEARVHELNKYGLIEARTLGGVDYFDADALAVAQAAAGFLQFGIEARHLRPFKSAAEREAGLFEQIVLALLKQRNPTARRQAAETLDQLGGLGEALRGALVRQAVRNITG